MFDKDTYTAARIFDVPPSKVTPEQRQWAANQRGHAEYSKNNPPKDYFRF